MLTAFRLPMRSVAITIFLALSFGVTCALAGITAPSSQASLSADGKHVLVMISPIVDYDRKHPVTFSLPGGRSVILHETFPKSGSYGSTTLEADWQVDWFSFERNLRWTDDCSDVVRLNQYGLGSKWGIEFYHRGQLVRRYDCEHLLTGLKQPVFFPFSNWDYYSEWWDVFELRDHQLALTTTRRRLHFSTHELNLGLSESYTFDLSTGAIISRSTTGAGEVWLVITPVAFLFVMFILWWWLRKRL